MRRKRQPRHHGDNLLTMFLDFAYEHSQVKTSHIALYAHILTTYNKLGWPDEFALPTDAAMMRSHISNRRTYYNTLDALIRWGWIRDCGRNGRECRRVSLSEGRQSDAYGRSLCGGAEATASMPAEQAQTDEQSGSGDVERLDRIFAGWSANVRANDRRWVEVMMKETGIKDYDMAMSLFKEHIIRNSKVDAWIAMSLSERKSYFINSSRFFATEACKTVKETVARVLTIGGKPFVEQYGVREPLPDNYPPQPDVDYYWDPMWKSWRMA